MYTILKKWISIKQYSCEDISNMLGISKSYYSQLENGRRTLTYAMAVSIASIFDSYPDEIFYDKHGSDVITDKVRKNKKIIVSSYIASEND
jgi:transcriptional regulator with XRE-family HTH domain